jgi:hypothetical protein
MTYMGRLHAVVSCGRKVRYGSEETARKAIADLREKGKAATGRRGILEPYSCLYCGKWHIGHSGGRS